MIKGAKKQMIVLRTGGSRYFDTAYFVLRTHIRECECGREEILQEANRILEESAPAAPRKERRRKRWGLFLCGILCGALPGALAVVLICLLGGI